MENFLKRILNDKYRYFEIIINESSRGYFKIYSNGEKIFIEASSKSNAGAGLYFYLKKYLHINYSRCGNRRIEINEIVFPENEIYREINQKYVSMYNYCTYGYSMVFWDWERWEKELDYLALNGVNLPLFVVGIEAVWYKVLLKYGFTKEEALSFISSPCHFPWQLMTNIEGVMPVMSEKLILRREELGKKIIRRMLELGMTPIQMGFSGFVPKLFKTKYFKNSRINQKINWCGISGTCELDPADDLFESFGIDFLKTQKEIFGAYHYYACDPFHESQPPVKGKKYLVNVSKKIQRMYESFDSEYRWVMQSWSIRKTIVKAVDKKRLLILDLAGKNHRKTHHFWGYDYITGNLHNFGGRINLHGDIELLAKNQYYKKRFHKNAVGTGLFMEGIEQNPLYYDLAFEMLTQSKEINLKEYLDDYSLRRYGSRSEKLKEAVRLLSKSVYRKGTNDVENSSMICARPAINVKKSGPNNPFNIPYDNNLLIQALGLMLSENTDGLKDGYYFDIYDICRQLISNRLQLLSKKIREYYEKKEKNNFLNAKNRFLTYLLLADELLLTREEFNLYTRLNAADSYTENSEINKKLICAYKTLLTLWADIETPDIFDYAWREWGGIIGEFYYKRWEMFFDFLESEFEKPDRYNLKKEEKLQRCYGRESFFANDFYRIMGNFEIEWTKKPYEPRSVKCSRKQTHKLALQIYQRLISDN